MERGKRCNKSNPLDCVATFFLVIIDLLLIIIVVRTHMAMDKKHLDDIKKYDKRPDMELVEALYRRLAGTLARSDARWVSFTDPKELGRVRRNFVMGRLGVKSKAKADEAIAMVGDKMKKDRTKSRLTAYYLLTQHFKAKKKVC